MDATVICLDAKFDVAFSNAVLHWIPDHQAVLRGLRKHLKPRATILLQMGGAGNASEIVTVVESLVASHPWSEYFAGFTFPYSFYDVSDYERWLPRTGYKATRIERIPKDMVHKNIAGLEGWLRTTWFPYANRVPEEHRDRFLNSCLRRGR